MKKFDPPLGFLAGNFVLSPIFILRYENLAMFIYNFGWEEQSTLWVEMDTVTLCCGGLGFTSSSAV